MLLFEHRKESPYNCIDVSLKDVKKETAVVVLMSGVIRLTTGLTVMGINNERLCCAASVLLCMKFVDF
jgi:hypothetical protein